MIFIDKLKFLLLPAALFIFGVYAFFRPSLSPEYNHFSMLIIALCALYILLNKFKINMGSAVNWVACYFLLGGVSVLFPPSPLASAKIWTDATLSVGCGLVVFYAFSSADQHIYRIIKKLVISLWCIFAALIISYKYFNVHYLLSDLPFLSGIVQNLNIWMIKYQAIFLLLLTWISVTYISASLQRFRYALILILLSISCLAFLINYSRSAFSAFIVSVLFFFYGLLAKKLPAYLLSFLIIVSVCAVPLLYGTFILFPSIQEPLFHKLPLAVISGGISRISIWNYALRIASLNPLTGLGFGSSHSLPGDAITAMQFCKPFEFLSQLRGLPLYPGRHPHSFILLTLLDLGIAGVVLYTGFLLKLARGISRAPVNSLCACCAGCLLLSCVIVWQTSYSYWNFNTLLLLSIIAGLTSLCLKHSVVENKSVSETSESGGFDKKLLPLFFTVGSVILILQYAQVNYLIHDLEKSDITLSHDLSSIIINNREQSIGSVPGGFLDLVQIHDNQVRLAGWAGDIQEDNNIFEVMFFYGNQKIGMVRPFLPRFDVRLNYANTRLLFSGFDCTITINNMSFLKSSNFRAIAFFSNGTARYLLK